MRRFILYLLAIFLASHSYAQQNVAINSTGTLPHASAQLDVSSSTKGILIPRMTSSQRTAITSPAISLMVFDTDTNSFWFYNGTAWTNLSASSTGWLLNGNSGTNPSTNYIGTSDNTDLRFKINSANAGLLSNNGNVFWGLRSGNSNTTAYSNVAIGIDALKINTVRNNTVAIGDSALFNNGAGVTQSDQALYNSATGSKSLFANTTGSYNTAQGFQSLYSNTTGSWNTANGLQALYSNTSGNYNTGTAVDALRGNTSGSFNTADGYRALFLNSSGNWNTANGILALNSNTSGSNNTANGGLALYGNTSGNSNVAVGISALLNNTDRSKLVAIGDSALFNNGLSVTQAGEAIFNVALGSKSLYTNSTGSYNTSLGSQSLYSNSSGNYNTAGGFEALRSNSTGSWNTAVGLQSLYLNTTGDYNTATAVDALHSNTTGKYGTATGYRALYLNTTGDGNSAHGFLALVSNTTGSNNTANGAFALYGNTTGYSNVAIGTSALLSNTTRSNLVAVGDSALMNNGNGAFQSYHATGNTAVGSKALYATSTGYYNTATGYSALYNNTTGNENTAMGSFALNVNTQGYDNSAYGLYALSANTTGNYNTGIGGNSLFNNTAGTYNTAIGYYASLQSDGFSNATAVGAYARVNCSNCVVLGSIGPTGGSFTNVGIGLNTPTSRLSISADGTELGGTAASPIFKTNAGVLGNNANDYLKIGNLGFLSGNFSSLGVRAYRYTTGAGWQNSAIVMAYDVDNSFNPGGAGTNYFAFSGNGSLGIGTLAPGFLFEVNGTAGKPGGGSWSTSSDARLKQSIQPYTDGLSSLMKINPVRFHYNEKSGYNTKPEYVGVIAQELQTVAPYMVNNFQKNGETYLGVDNSAMIYMLINAVKELQKQVDELKKKIELKAN